MAYLPTYKTGMCHCSDTWQAVGVACHASVQGQHCVAVTREHRRTPLMNARDNTGDSKRYGYPLPDINIQPLTDNLNQNRYFSSPLPAVMKEREREIERGDRALTC